MTDSNLFEILGLSPSATLDAVEAKFIETVRARIQEVATSFDEESVKAEEQALRSLHEQFFKYSMVWAAAEMKKPRENPDHADAAKLKKKARTMIEAMQGNIIEFALCYMQINRYGTLLRDEIEMLMAERQALLRVVGASAVLIASLESKRLPLGAVESADLVATTINALSEETLQDALGAVHAEIERTHGGGMGAE